MHYLVKSIDEWRHYGCSPKSGARPYSDRSVSAPAFELRDMQPMSKRGEDYLRYCFDEVHREEARLHRDDRMRSHIDDAMTYGRSTLSPGFLGEFEHNLKTRKKKMSKMTHNRAMADALLDNFHTVDVYIEGAIWTYKMPKDMTLEKDDMIIVPKHDRMVIAKVQEVHGRVKNSKEIELRWIVGKIDTTDYDAYAAQDEKAMEVVLDLEKRKTKREMLNELTEDMSEEDMSQLNHDLGITPMPQLENT